MAGYWICVQFSSTKTVDVDRKPHCNLVGCATETTCPSDLASPSAFAADPSLVWEFYHYRREVMLSKDPNAAHAAIAAFEERAAAEGRQCVVVTQNIDELHRRAGTADLVELHGSLFRTMCTRCGVVENNYDSPICEALRVGSTRSNDHFTRTRFALR